MGRAVTVAMVLALLGAAPAHADETIQAIAPNQFAQAVTTIDQGEKVFIQNLDLAGHDVTSVTNVFRSEIAGTFETLRVVGTEYLKTGTYPFVCSVHPGMEATLEVNAAGTPAPPPKVTVKVTSKKLGKVRKDKKINIVVSADTALSLTLSAKLGTQSLGAGTAEVTEAGKDGEQAVSINLHKAGRKALKGKKKAKITVTAKGPGGSQGSATRTLN